MPVPASITYLTVTDRYVDASGTAMSGTVTFTPQATRIVDTADGVSVAAAPVRASLDGTGNLSVSLMSGDDTDVDPSGWTYLVEENLVSASSKVTNTYLIALTSVMSSPQGLAELVPAESVTIPGGLVRPALIAARYTSFTAVSNTTAETTVANLTIPEGATETGSILMFEAGGTLVNSSGSGINHVLKLKLGSTTLITSAATAVANSASACKWHLKAPILWGTATTQRTTATLTMSPASSATWATGSDAAVGYGTAAEAMSSGTDVTFSVTPASASSSYSMQATWAKLTREA